MINWWAGWKKRLRFGKMILSIVFPSVCGLAGMWLAGIRRIPGRLAGILVTGGNLHNFFTIWVKPSSGVSGAQPLRKFRFPKHSLPLKTAHEISFFNDFTQWLAGTWLAGMWLDPDRLAGIPMIPAIQWRERKTMILSFTRDTTVTFRSKFDRSVQL